MKNVFVFLQLLVFADCAKARDVEEVRVLLKRTFYYEFSSSFKYVGKYEPRTDSIAFVLIQLDKENRIEIAEGDTLRMAYYGPNDERELYSRLLKGDSIRKTYIDFPIFLDYPLICRDSTCYAKFDFEECFIESFGRGYGNQLIDDYVIYTTGIEIKNDVLLLFCHLGKMELAKIRFSKNCKMMNCTYNDNMYFYDIRCFNKFLFYSPSWTDFDNLRSKEGMNSSVTIGSLVTQICELAFDNSPDVAIFGIKSDYCFISYQVVRKEKSYRVTSSPLGLRARLPSIFDIFCDSNLIFEGNMNDIQFNNIQVEYQLELHSDFEISDSARKSLQGLIQELKINKPLRVAAPFGRNYVGKLFRPDQQAFIHPIYYFQSDEPILNYSYRNEMAKNGLLFSTPPEKMKNSEAFPKNRYAQNY